MELGEELIKMVAEMKKAKDSMMQAPSKWVLQLNAGGKVVESYLEYWAQQ